MTEDFKKLSELCADYDIKFTTAQSWIRRGYLPRVKFNKNNNSFVSEKRFLAVMDSINHRQHNNYQ